MAGEFGKFKDSLNKSIASIGAKASNSVEKSRLKNQMDTLSKETDVLMMELGRKVYSSWREGNSDCSVFAPQFELIQTKLTAIQSAFNEIKAIEERERLASQPTPIYVQTQQASNNVYSSQPVVVPVNNNSVTQVPPVVSTNNNQASNVENTAPTNKVNEGCVCPNCGASFNTEINFCRMCGTKIKQ